MVLVEGGVLHNNNNGAIAGGQPGSSTAYTGDGGAGVFLVNGGILDNQVGGTVSGGGGVSGGIGYSNGAAGVLANRGAVDNAGTITGGAGDARNGGLGGSGLRVNGTAVVNALTGVIAGGRGGNSIRSNQSAGNGGTGITFINDGGSLENAGSISGGNGGGVSGLGGGTHAAGGVGVLVESSGTTLVNAGSIAGGLSGDGSTRANAIEINGNDNILELRSGSTLDGDVVASGSGNALLLDGNGSEDSGFSGFSTLQASAGSNWILSGALGITSGGLSIDVVDSGSLRLDGPLTGSGDLTLASSVDPSGYGFGTLSISGDNIYTGDTRIGGGDVLTYVLATNSNAFGTGTVTVADKGQLDLSPPSGGTFSNDLIIGNGGNVTLEPTVTLDEQAISIESGGGLSASGSDLAGATLHNAGSLALSARRISDPVTGFTNIAVQGANASVINDATGVLNLAGSASTGIALGSLSGGGTIVLGAANLSVGALDNDDIISGTIQDLYPEDLDLGTGGSLTKVGSGSLTLTGTNTYTGGTTIAAGTLVGSAASFGSGDIVNDAILVFDQAQAGTYAGDISGSGVLNKRGDGTLILDGNNTYSGGTSIAGGTLSISSDAALGNASGGLTLDGGTLRTTSDFTSARNLTLGEAGGTLNADADFSLSGAIAGTGSLALDAGGNVILAGTVQAASLAVTAENFSAASTLMVDGDLSITTTSGGISQSAAWYVGGATALATTGDILLVNASNDFVGTVAVDAGGAVRLADANTLSLGTVNAISLTVAASQIGLAADVTTSGAQAYTDAVTLGGDVTLASTASGDIAFGASVDGAHALMVQTAGTTTFDGVVGGTTALSSLSVSADAGITLGGGVTTSGALTLDSDAAIQQTAGSLSGSQLFKQGDGTLTLLTAGNAFTSGTRVQAGSLIVGASAGSAASLGGDVTVEGGALLGGHGLIGGDVTIASGATLSPGTGSGAAGVGTLSIGGDLTLASGSTLAYQLGVPGTATLPGSSDRVAVSGDLSLDGTLNLSDAGGAGLGYYRLMTYGGALDDNGLTPGTNLAEPALYTIQAGNGNVDLFVAASGDATLQHWQGGDGTWNGASAQWLNQDGQLPVAWAGNHAVFKDANGFEGGTITLEGTQAFAGLQFVNEGYSLVSAPGLDGLLRTDGSSEIRVLADSAEIAVGIVGNGGIVKTEAGTLILDGNNTYTGDTSVQAGGLTIGGSAGSGASLTSDVNVWDGARLGGHGSIVGNVNLADGATLAPGNSIGTLTVDGDVSFAPSAVFEVEANPDGTADKLVATGTVTLGDSTLNVLAGAGDWSASTRYDLVEAGNLVGTFGTVNSNLAFLNADLAYDYALNTVELTLLRNDTAFASVARTFNQTATASALSSLDPTSGLATAITALSEEGARDAYDSLSGELHASLQSALLDDSRYLREGVNARLLAAQHLLPGSGQLNQGDGVTFWLQGYGGWAQNEGDGNASTLDHDSRGTLFGGDIALDDAWRIGAAIGLGSSDLKDGRDSSADVDTRSLALYASGQWDAVKLRVGASHSWHDVDTRRNVHFGSFSERNKASYDATTTQAFAELGYRLAAADFQVEPFIGLAHAKVKSDGFSERGGDSALSAGNEKRDITYSTLGAHAALPVGQFAGSPVSLQGSLGWQHAFGNDTPDSHLAFTTGDAFSIRGTPLERDSAVAQLGIQTQLNRNIAVDLSYSGRFGEDFTDNGLRLGLTAKF
ncbi:hypothetical protein DNK06_24625 [Pseudomonas daroniae]|uniref:Autotransporter domain-containing protein n=1 Tax=Phytopseudomonas daroniae TaxID=2487519 RepID=A0A4Q9QER1_9GAMM|nr:hypothetical protein DNK06_24625 [Pseudomonas daroniae]TBU73755.1 hypothetical protein DNK31_24575 [Pseudomonas sp. FRB 228]TBU86682.1 hypothetical protein DNJ99_23780 [Pseudomonas daroniae]